MVFWSSLYFKLNFANLILSLPFIYGIKSARSLATKFQGHTVFSSSINTNGGGNQAEHTAKLASFSLLSLKWKGGGSGYEIATLV